MFLMEHSHAALGVALPETYNVPLNLWAMHFIGMLAFSLPIPNSYEKQSMLLWAVLM